MNRSIALALWIVLGCVLGGAAFVGTRASWRERRVAELLSAVDSAIEQAERQQQAASLAGIAGAEARLAARRENTSASVNIATHATSVEREARAQAAETWERAQGVINDALGMGGDDLGPSVWDELRRLHNRARMGTGDLAGAAEDLERMLEARSDDSDADPGFTARLREDLATTYYHAARLMRLRGDPERAWQPVCERARQHAKLLAEGGAGVAGADRAGTRYQRNLEVIMDFERTPLDMLEGEMLPEDCPGGNCRNLNLDTWPWLRRGKPRNPDDDRGSVTGGGGGSGSGS